MKKVSEAKCIRIYGPYNVGKKVVWWLFDEKGKKYTLRTKLELLQLIDRLTTEIKGNR